MENSCHLLNSGITNQHYGDGPRLSCGDNNQCQVCSSSGCDVEPKYVHSDADMRCSGESSDEGKSKFSNFLPCVGANGRSCQIRLLQRQLSTTSDNRINNLPVTRSDSTALDISLEEMDTMLNQSVNQAQSTNSHAENGRLRTENAQTNYTEDRQSYQQQQKHNIRQVCEYIHALIPTGVLFQPSNFFNGSQTMNEQCCCAFASHTNKPCQDYVGSNTSRYVSQTLKNPNNIVKNSQESNSTQKISRGNAQEFSSKDDFDQRGANDTTKVQKSVRRNSQHYSENRNGTTFCKQHAARNETPFYVLSAVVVVLALIITHLYVRVQALEDMDRTRCHCGQTKSTLLDTNTETFMYAHDNNDDTYNALLHGANSNKDIQKISKNTLLEHTSLGEPKSRKVRSVEGSDPTEHSSKTETTVDEDDVTSADGASLRKSTEDMLKGKQNRSRRVRHTKQKEYAPEYMKTHRKRYFKECKSQVYSLCGNLSMLFNFSQDFLPQNSVSHKLWRPEIRAYRSGNIVLPHYNTTLPFYMETAEMAKKKDKLIHLNYNELGKFRIKKPGDYLISLNITTVDMNETLPLALYLNGEAMLSCTKGGFRCPHTNLDHSNKYKVCNIFGLLELKKNDTLDVRTAVDNVTVRLEALRPSVFKIVRLSLR